MADYGRPLRFGWFADPDLAHAHTIVDAARVADRSGLDLIGVQDHPYNPRHLDAWTLLTALGTATERLTVFPDVANLPLRGPVMLARSAATLDVLTGGRVAVGLGTGVLWDGIEALGGPRRTRKEAVDAATEAVEILQGWWSGRRSLTVDGDHYRVAGARPGPQPTGDGIPLWLGAIGPRMLGLLGRRADGWLPSLAFVPPEKLAEAHARIDAGAAAAGRDPAEIDRIYNVWGDHSPREWVELLTELTLDHGMNGYVFGAPPSEPALRTIAEEIAPAVRAAVDAERTHS